MIGKKNNGKTNIFIPLPSSVLSSSSSSSVNKPSFISMMQSNHAGPVNGYINNNRNDNKNDPSYVNHYHGVHGHVHDVYDGYDDDDDDDDDDYDDFFYPAYPFSG